MLTGDAGTFCSNPHSRLAALIALWMGFAAHG